ncbi:MAG: type II toxin-antitoxin system death-on-curing family toxin [Planctomycetota bacterium]|nr:type II toxin-antitoxin system death-on-curing family toxin [Planctomycetota bacterium]
MKHSTFLSVEDVICIHADAIEAEGGFGGVRDYGLLESAVMMPQQQFSGQYLHEDFPAMAAAYLYHIAQSHPFHDGNKRAGVMSAFVFLDANGVNLTAGEKHLEQTVMAVAAGKMSKNELIIWMREYTRPRKR